MKNILFISFLMTLVIGEKINVVTSTTDLADIAKTIGGNRVTVTSIARGNQDPHYVEVLPSYMIKVKRADVYFMVGMELDLWAQQIIDGSRNRNLKIVDCSADVIPLEKPTGKVDASLGDIHRFGNPHYWLDPENGKLIAKQILEALISLDPDGEDLFSANYREFVHTVDMLLIELHNTYSGLKEKKIIFYHNSWPYFTRQFGLITMAFIEPKPGISPSPAHLESLINTINAGEIHVIALESYFSTDAVEFLARKTGVKYVRLSQSVGAISGVDSYPDLFRYNLNAIQSAY